MAGSSSSRSWTRPLPSPGPTVGWGKRVTAGIRSCDCRTPVDPLLPLAQLPSSLPRTGYGGNGRIERSIRTDEEEFYLVEYLPADLGGLEQALLAWNHTHESVRPHQAMGYKTPDQFYSDLLKYKCDADRRPRQILPTGLLGPPNPPTRTRMGGGEYRRRGMRELQGTDCQGINWGPWKVGGETLSHRTGPQLPSSCSQIRRIGKTNRQPGTPSELVGASWRQS